MGILLPFCVATDNTRLYAIARATPYTSKTEYFLLIKSNDNPSSDLSNLNWTLVSAVPVAGYTNIKVYDLESLYTCAINDAGVFSIIATDLISAAYLGLQYQPLGTGGSGPAPVVGGGVWKNFTFGATYNWPTISGTPLFNLKDIQGINTLMQVYIAQNLTDFFVAALDSTTMVMNRGEAPWAIGPDHTYWANHAVAHVGSSMYTFGEGWPNEYIITIPWASPTTTVPSGGSKFDNATAITAVCGTSLVGLSMRPMGDRLLIGCLNQRPGHFFSYDGNTITQYAPVLNVPTQYLSMVHFPGTPNPFVFMHDQSSLYSIPLNGTLASTVIISRQNFTIAECYGINPSPAPSSTGSVSQVPFATDTVGSNSSSGGGAGLGSSSAGLIGGVCAVVVLVIVGLTLVYFRKKRQLQEGQKKVGAKMEYYQNPEEKMYPPQSMQNMAPMTNITTRRPEEWQAVQ
ncbi:hypothetical protein BGZ54_002496, partial [Gamsiella multidivaricata]